MPSNGATATRHAKAVLEGLAPPASRAIQYAGKRVVRNGDRIFSVAEDLFGCFDALYVGPGRVFPLLVQWTTETSGGQTTTSRKRKIETRFLVPLDRKADRFEIEVWSWVRRRHFRRWIWNTARGQWVERDPIESPLLRRRAA